MQIIKFRVMVRHYPDLEAHESDLSMPSPYSRLLHEDYDDAIQEKKKALEDDSVAFAYIEEVKEKAASVSEIIDEVKTQICSFYCKYPYEWDDEKEGMDLCESPYCRSCPLGRL